MLISKIWEYAPSMKTSWVAWAKKSLFSQTYPTWNSVNSAFTIANWDNLTKRGGKNYWNIFFKLRFTPRKAKQPLNSRLKTVDIGILVISRHGEPIEPVTVNICQRNTYRKNFSWLHFDNEPKVSANPSFIKNNFSSSTDPSIFS